MAVRYGTMRDNVLGLKVVLANGRVITTGTRARKSSAGYDLTRLFVGAEGTLGVITEVTVRLHGLPEAVSAAVCGFTTMEGAVQTVMTTIQLGIPVARIELLDEVQVKASNAYSKLTLPETPMLFLEFHGTTAGVAEQSERFGEIAADLGGGPFAWTTNTEERTKLWQARHDAYWAAVALRPGTRPFATDVCVPLSRLAECVVETQRDIVACGMIAPIAGHVGDGNFHCSPLIDMDNPQEVAAARDFNARLIERALAMEGTCTGEHGVGQGKMKYLKAEHGEALGVMRSIKHALDPNDLMNPGKIVAF
jgi:D-lactate dehydrogenase (cytochrome)